MINDDIVAVANDLVGRLVYLFYVNGQGEQHLDQYVHGTGKGKVLCVYEQ